MNLPTLLLSPLGAGLLWASVCDLRRRRIPNAVSAFVFVSGLGVSAYLHGTLALDRDWRRHSRCSRCSLPALAGGRDRRGRRQARGRRRRVGRACDTSSGSCLPRALAGGVVAATCYLFARPPRAADVRANLVLAGAHGELPPTCLRTAKGTSPFLTPSRFPQARLSRFSSLRCKIGACCALLSALTKLNPLRGPSMNSMLSVIAFGRDVIQGDALGYQ